MVKVKKELLYALRIPVSIDVRYKLKIEAANQQTTVQKLINTILEKALIDVVTKTNNG